MFTILIFLAVLFVLILVHEWGHYIVAKLTKMRVDEFGIGFPPKLFSVKRGETEYTLNALPLGGFVKILGENGDEGGEVLSEADKMRTFSARPKWAQALVLIAGVTMNWIFAWFLLVVIMVVGVPTQVSEESATSASKLYIDSILSKSPADGVLPAHVEVLGVETADETLDKLVPSEFSNFIANHGGEVVTINYRNTDDVESSVEITPVSGVIESSPERAAVGVSLSLVETVQKPFGTALVDASVQTYTLTKAIAGGLFGLIGSAIVGTADFSQVSGPVGIVGYVGEAAAVGFTSLLFFTAIISINLAVINLLPIPALDGGRLVFVAIETITRKEIPPVWAGRVNLIGFVLLMGLMLAATVSDVIKLF
jgi:regulator of sigma E protease